jgi:Holliday junction resolvase-like predicted endonuclease
LQRRAYLYAGVTLRQAGHKVIVNIRVHLRRGIFYERVDKKGRERIANKAQMYCEQQSKNAK